MKHISKSYKHKKKQLIGIEKKARIRSEASLKKQPKISSNH